MVRIWDAHVRTRALAYNEVSPFPANTGRLEFEAGKPVVLQHVRPHSGCLVALLVARTDTPVGARSSFGDASSLSVELPKAVA